MLQRIIGVFQLRVGTFEEIEHDPSATAQAALVVALVALLGGLGMGISPMLFGQGEFSSSSFLGGLIWAFLGWLLWSASTYFVGTRFFGGQADLGEMLRVIGFANAPLVLGIIPCIGGLIGSLWALAAGFVAIRQGLDLDNTRALVTVLIGFAVYVIGMVTIGFLIPGL